MPITGSGPQADEPHLSQVPLRKVINKAQNISYEVVSISGRDITLNIPIMSHYGIFVDYERSTASNLTEVIVVGAAILDQIEVSNRYIDSISSIHNNTTGVDYIATYFTDRMVKLPVLASTGDEIEISYTYIEPFKIIITDAREQKSFKPIGEMLEGDVMLTFSHYLDIGDRDRITIIDEDVSTRFNELCTKGSDKLKMDYIVNILEIRDRNRVYVPDVDYRLFGTHKIEWIGGGQAPGEGEAYSVMYTAKREYLVWGEGWQERHHGNILLPRRLMARRFDRLNFYQDSSFSNEA